MGEYSETTEKLLNDLVKYVNDCWEKVKVVNPSVYNQYKAGDRNLKNLVNAIGGLKVDPVAPVEVIPSKYNSSYVFNPTSNGLKVEQRGAMKIPWESNWMKQALTDVNLGNVTTIKSGKFAGYVGLTSIVLNDVTTLKGSSFLKGADNVKTVVMNKVTQLGSSTFADNTKTSDSKLAEVQLASVEKMSSNNFLSCVNLSSVTLTNLKQMSGSNFKGCTRLSNIYLPSLEKLGTNNFNKCGVEILNLPNLQKMSTSTFKGAEKIKEIHVKGGGKVYFDFQASNAQTIEVYIGQTSTFTTSSFKINHDVTTKIIIHGGGADLNSKPIVSMSKKFKNKNSKFSFEIK